MSADHEIHDELLARVLTELRRPVRLDPGLDRRVLQAIRDGTGAPGSRPMLRPLWAGGAALAAGLLLAVFLRSAWERTPAPAPAAVATHRVGTVEGTRPVHLRLTAPASSRVAVVGDFNDWDPSATPLQRAEQEGVWTVELQLKPGRYHYSFLIDGRRWASDPSEPRAPESDFGAPVSVLTVS